MADTNETTIVEYSEDLGKQEAPPLLPVGDYPAEIRSAKVKTGSGSGRRYYEVAFMIRADDYPADFTGGDPDGELVIFRRVSAEDAPRQRYQARKFIESIGAIPSKMVDCSEWQGRSALVSIDHSSYEGETRLEAKKVSRLG